MATTCFFVMNLHLFSSCLLALLLLLPACSAEPPPGYSLVPPNAAAPTAEELKALFYEKAPEHSGKELVVRYRVGEEWVWKKLPNGGMRRVGTGRRMGYASVNTAAFDEKVEGQGRRILGGGTLRVRFELETGALIGRPLRDK